MTSRMASARAWPGRSWPPRPGPPAPPRPAPEPAPAAPPPTSRRPWATRRPTAHELELNPGWAPRQPTTPFVPVGEWRAENGGLFRHGTTNQNGRWLSNLFLLFNRGGRKRREKATRTVAAEYTAGGVRSGLCGD
jgi:hypothetical protein